MKESFFVRGLAGEKKLEGRISVGGAKNAILKVLAATTLFDDRVTLQDVPDIEDVHRMCELLENLGASVAKQENRTYAISAGGNITTTFDRHISSRLRASIVLVGPILARCGKVEFPHPGGCVIGARPIDYFLEGFEKLGATVEHKDEHYHIEAKGGRLRGADIFFPTPSHTVTETMMMAATLAEGRTTLKNCAMEPEIADLASFLNLCGAKIRGAGTSTIVIEGGKPLRAKGQVYRPIPDRIETGSFLILGALSARELVIENCNPVHIEILIELLRKSGVAIETEADKIILHNNTKPNSAFRSLNIKTHEYPGFATDLQAPMVVYLTQVMGEGVVFETIFEGRLHYTNDVVRMGADITTWDAHRVQVKGPTPLIGRALGSPDLRAGLAFIIAASVAKGNSLIDNVYYIDRGYERIEERLSGIGLDITRRQEK